MKTSKEKPKIGFTHRSKLYREARERRELTQAEMAKDLGRIHSQFVSNWERELCDIPDHALKAFVYKYGIKKDRFKMAFMNDYAAFVEDLARWVYNK